MSAFMTQHTPGPWGCEETPESSHWDWKVTQPRINGRRPYIGIDTFNPEADARLIAAAPEMLEVLQRIVAWNVRTLESGTRTERGITEAQLSAALDAVAKATGSAT